MAEWVKFDGSKQQLQMLKDAKYGWLFRFKDNSILECGGCFEHLNLSLHEINEFLICDPHPHIRMIAEWARTGRPVYFFDTASGEWLPVKKPDWDENTRYLFDPPKKKLRYKRYLSNYCMEHEIRVKNEGDNKEPIGFIRWLDDDWQEVEV